MLLFSVVIAQCGSAHCWWENGGTGECWVRDLDCCWRVHGFLQLVCFAGGLVVDLSDLELAGDACFFPLLLVPSFWKLVFWYLRVLKLVWVPYCRFCGWAGDCEDAGTSFGRIKNARDREREK